MDAKALLRAQKAAAKVQHPYASYNASGQLRCIVCAVPADRKVKQWDAHLLTKQHRQSVQRERAEEAKRAAAAAKRKQAAEPEPETAKRQRVTEPEPEEEEDDRPSLPPGFFSSGNGPSVAEDDEQESSAPPPKEEKKGDAELDAFLASLNDVDDAPAPTAAEQGETAKTKATKKRRVGYKESEEDGVASISAAPVLIQRNEAGEEKEPTPEPEETEQERRERLAREEKEEIIARLEEEQRAQEDADNRVLALKARMEALKKKREAKKAKA
ncbi:hypothetical protein A1Q2_06293 [Trichosporon asahii var. asahii CBS 8904]|uniref:Zinc finger protein 830 n=1 Tax=Trichosporon asahii var. asahii (strain CBS 8904) TaxID=1220162 RepID=K1VJJ0_TRIAC|nr:hypothetical protein A1Q2_06293 [Trichosporon asahii var. asahii CBS 8904]